MSLDKLQALPTRSRSPLNDQAIAMIEQRVGHPLPGSYADMLRRYGGLSFSDVFYWDPKVREHIRFSWFYDLSELSDALDSHADAIPESVIPVGEDVSGNLFCVGISGSDRNRVYFHNHSVGWQSDADQLRKHGEEVPADIRHRTVYLLADSFESFIEQLVHREE